MGGKDLQGAPLLRVDSLTKTFSTLDGHVPVLDQVSLEVGAGEVVALLGRSGSGKSTLLRCIAGLLTPSAGVVRYRGSPLDGLNPGVSMVFQNFALLPWLTVLQNVELGLEAKGVDAATRQTQALRAIDLIGLDGFESAYPKELSGGMRQRVGFARALVVEPDVLLMDEPFSALDVLTAENLRGELMELWTSDEVPIQSILLVTHNIEEAVQLADRVIILGSNPGRVRLELAVPLARPRDRTQPEFQLLVDEIYTAMTEREADAVESAAGDRAPTSVSHPLPHASVDALSGLAEVLLFAGTSPIADTARELGFEVDDLLPLVDALELLGFVTVEDGRVELTNTGATFAGADIQASKRIFARAALDHAPLVHSIAAALERTPNVTLRPVFFLEILGRHFSAQEAERQLDIALDWGRYAEQYAFDADREEIVADPDRFAILDAR